MAKNARQKRKDKANCKKKVRYDVPLLARKAGQRQNMRMYKCPVCKAFHLTSRLEK